ncbi:hypothetical protein PUN28_001701 [Cardiocondyla obscurior]
MRAPLVFCVVAIFHVIFVASHAEDHQIQNSTMTRDVECKANCTKSLRDQILTLISSNKKDDYKRKGRVDSSRMKRRTTHRPHTKSNGKSRNSTIRGNRGFGQQADRVLPVSNETHLYESVDVFLWNRTSDTENVKIHIGESLDDYYPFYGGLESLLTRLIKALENNSKEDDDDGGDGDDDEDVSASSGAVDDEDRCQKWLDNWEKIESVFPGSVADLPGCPCLYPNGVFYDNQIWDKKRQRKFRWRDVSHDKDRLAIYKPGAVYCVQTLPSQENESAIVQHCCYGENRKLLTRGSGAGTPYIVSPEISPLLHDKIDLLPWRLCKGDFTR